MADLLNPHDVLSGDRLSLNAIHRLAPRPAPGSPLARPAPSSQPVDVDRNILAIEAQLADGQTCMMHCVELTPDRRPSDDYVIMAHTRPGEVSGLLRGITIYVRGRLHQRLEMEAHLGLTQGLQLTFVFAAYELRL